MKKIIVPFVFILTIFGCATVEDARILNGEAQRLQSELMTVKAENESIRRQYPDIRAIKADNELMRSQFKAFQEENRQNLIALRSAAVKDYGSPIEKLSNDLEHIRGEIESIRAEMSTRQSIQSPPVPIRKTEPQREKSISQPGTQSEAAEKTKIPGPIVQAEVIGTKDAYKFVGQKKTVCGEVASAMFAARSKGQPTFLNLDQPYPNQTFTVVIWGSDRGKFKTSPEALFKGKRICVTGQIDTYRGKPQIVVRDPSEIIVQPSSSSLIKPPGGYHQAGVVKSYSPSYRARYYSARKRIEEGDDVEFYDYEAGEYRQGQVESISGNEVEIYDDESGEYKYVDIDDIED